MQLKQLTGFNGTPGFPTIIFDAQKVFEVPTSRGFDVQKFPNPKGPQRFPCARHLV